VNRDIRNQILRYHYDIIKQLFSLKQISIQIALLIEKVFKSKLLTYFLKRLRNEQMVMSKYDRMSGRYIKEYHKMMASNEKAFVIYNNQYQFRPIKDVIQEKEKYISDLIKSYSPINCIEIGAGELTFITPIAAMLKNVTFSALDLSWSRLYVGLSFAKEFDVHFEHIVMGSAENLPFPEKSFDIVVTNHCLEQIRGNMKHIISELYRISRKALILLEPSADLGNWLVKQQLRMNQRVRGIKKTIDSLGYNVERYEWFPYSRSYTNRTGIYIIKRNTNGIQYSIPYTNTFYICPICKRELKTHNFILFCDQCGKSYPVIKNIPCLTDSSGILTSRLSDEI